MAHRAQAGADEPIEAVIVRAREDMRAYQESLTRQPDVGAVELGGVSHALVPIRVIARDLPRIVDEIVGPERCPEVIYRVGRAIGEAHAEAFFRSACSDGAAPDYRILAGPFHLTWGGYGDVELLVWEPRVDERFAVLWEAEHSASARSAAGGARRTRACNLEAGYSAGWCAAATGLRLVARELACRAEGIRRCRFLIVHEDHAQAAVVEPRFHLESSRYSLTPVRVGGRV
jgi:predicted hydrocarbon binding protein